MIKKLLFPLFFACALMACEKDDSEDKATTPVVSFSITETSLKETSGAFSVLLTCDNKLNTNATVEIALDGTAKYGEDYTTIPEASEGKVTLDIVEGEWKASFDIKPTKDDKNEENETVALELSVGPEEKAVVVGEKKAMTVTIKNINPDGTGNNGGGANPDGLPCTKKLETYSNITKTICSTNIAGLNVVFVEPSSGKPTRLAVLFPDKDLQADQLRRGLGGGLDFADENDLLLIAISDPEEKNWKKVKNHERVKEALEDVLEAYDLPSDNILFSGVDEGGHYLTDKFIPAFGDVFQGAFHLPSGIYQPSVASFAWDPTQKAELVNKFALFFDYGASYPALIGLSKEKIDNAYTQKGFKVTPKKDPGRCENNAYTNRLTFWQEYMQGTPYVRPAVGQITCEEQLKTHVDGMMVCKTKLAGIEVVYSRRSDGTSPKQLAVLFHGDGGSAMGAGVSYNMEFAKKHNLLLMAMSADAWKDSKTMGPIHSWAKKNCANGVREILHAFTDQFGLPKDKVLFSGASGGGWYLADELVPTLGGEFQGPVHMACGATRPNDSNFEWDPATMTTERDKLPLYFDYGTGDFVTPSIEKGIKYYKEKGFNVKTPDPLGNEGHCGTKYIDNRKAFWSKYLVK
ncbi:hypothetical protein FUAX_49560 (plasmid) [Fulvitalea axinellae]|uniref:Calx-beta domain-containing protein n=1 Tax=Fulvitalea axinellae TaxID=1182444 RepID=A0AAU9CKB4_9BACT|nr:hypothetical protein FUAX_49560 [Fulvitalea axinellae]